MDEKEKVEAKENVEKIKSPPNENVQEEKQKPKVKKRFTVWDYIRYLLSAGESKISTMATELIINLGLIVYLVIVKQDMQSWLISDCIACLLGIGSINAFSLGLNYMYNNYNQKQEQNQQMKKQNYDSNNDNHINFLEYMSCVLCAKEEKFSTIVFANTIIYFLGCYYLFTKQPAPTFIGQLLSYAKVALSGVNILGSGLGYGGYNMFGGYGVNSYQTSLDTNLSTTELTNESISTEVPNGY